MDSCFCLLLLCLPVWDCSLVWIPASACCCSVCLRGTVPLCGFLLPAVALFACVGLFPCVDSCFCLLLLCLPAWDCSLVWIPASACCCSVCLRGTVPLCGFLLLPAVALFACVGLFPCVDSCKYSTCCFD